MKIKITIALACVALASFADLDSSLFSPEQSEKLEQIRSNLLEIVKSRYDSQTNAGQYAEMASKALLNKRVKEAKELVIEATANKLYETQTNFDQRIVNVYRDMGEIFEKEAAQASTNAFRVSKNSEVFNRELYHGMINDYEEACTNIGIVITTATDLSLAGVYLVSDKSKQEPVVTNSIYNISCRSYNTEPVTYRFVTEYGEVYDSIPSIETNKWNFKIHTCLCSTNENRFIKFRGIKLDDESRRIILGQE